MTLTEAHRQALIEAARRSIEAEVRRRGHRVEATALQWPDATGVFVTIKRGAELRGCLGTLEVLDALDREVARCAADSAQRDPRFPPVTPDELDALRVEVSILGALEPLDPPHPEAIEIGRHGLVVEQGTRRGLLLPQVAIEWSWDAEQFLRQACRKARLPDDAWQTGAAVYRFEADVFGE
jgi:AmmeMemoRadiSam system protein A